MGGERGERGKGFPEVLKKLIEKNIFIKFFTKLGKNFPPFPLFTSPVYFFPP
jgi:hypothetical protein